MDFLKNFGLNLQSENGEKKCELKGVPGIIALGLFAIIGIVLLKSIFIGLFVFVFSVISFLLSPIGIALIIAVALFIGIDKTRREKFILFVNKYRQKEESISDIDSSLGRHAFDEDKK